MQSVAKILADPQPAKIKEPNGRVLDVEMVGDYYLMNEIGAGAAAKVY
jgi:hypothetical protein